MKTKIQNVQQFINRNKYEFLLFGLVQHLFVSVFISDLDFYARVVWPINMVILGITSVGVFSEKSKNEIIIKNILLLAVIILPLSRALFDSPESFLMTVSLVYTVFFGFIFYEVFQFLIKPEEFTTDVLSAAGCGYLLLIEIFAFLFQYLLYNDPSCLNIELGRNVSEIYVDLVYFVTISLTTIGFGDFSPTAHYTKLITSLMGLIGTFYTVVLTGILISNFAPNLLKNKDK
ncbi:MAG: ion channel [Moheibacter sp.]